MSALAEWLRSAGHLHLCASLAAEPLLAALDVDVLAAAAPVIAFHLVRRHGVDPTSKEPAMESQRDVRRECGNAAPLRSASQENAAEGETLPRETPNRAVALDNGNLTLVFLEVLVELGSAGSSRSRARLAADLGLVDTRSAPGLARGAGFPAFPSDGRHVFAVLADGATALSSGFTGFFR
jgi:hypothetical protein